MTRLPSRRWCFFLYACLTGLCLFLHNRMVDLPALNVRQEQHRQVMSGTASAPTQYRVMTFYIAEGIQRAASGLGMEDPFRFSYLLLRAAGTLLDAVLLHLFLASFVEGPGPLIGVLLFFCWLPFTYINYFMQEAEPLNLAFYIAGFMAIRSRRDGLFAALLPLSILNRENTALLPLAWLLVRWDERPWTRTLAKSLLWAALVLGPFAALRGIFGHRAAYAEMLNWVLNLRNPYSYASLFLLFAPVLPFLTRAHVAAKPADLRRLGIFALYFLAFQAVFPILEETRELLPVFPIALAWILTSWSAPLPDGKEPERRPPVPPALFHGVLAAAFVLAMGGFAAYLERFYHEPLRRQQALDLWREGLEAYRQGGAGTAERDWRRASLLDPKNPDLHAGLAGLYAGVFYEPQLAADEIAAGRRLAPTDPRWSEIDKRLDERRKGTPAGGS